MELPIKHKRGTTIPTASDLVVGEIAINTATGLCYTKTGAGNVVAIGLDVAANWGNIGGTLSSQTDLQSALNLKANLTGATFTGKVTTTQTTTTAPLNLGFLSTAPTTTVAGDLWVGDNLNFKDKSGTQKAVANTSTQNTFTQPQIIAPAASATLPALRITNLSTTPTGHSIVVEDNTNSDGTSFIVNNDGRVGIGVPSTWTPVEKLDIIGYGTSNTAPFSDQSTKLATTENVKASICGSVTSVPSSGWQVSYSTGYPNQIVKVYDDSTSGAMSVPSETHIPIGTRYTFIQTQTLPFYFMAEGGGAGLFSFENKFTSAGPYAICNLIKTSHHEWFLTGDLVACPPAGTFISSQCVTDSYTGPNGTSTGDWGYEVTRANGSCGTYSTIEGSNTGGCYHPSGLTYYSNSSDIYFPGPYGDVNVGTSNYNEYADGNGGTYTDSSNSYNAGCGGTYASQPGYDGATGYPMTTYWKIDCANDTYYTEGIIDAGYVMSQSCSTALSTDAAGVEWTVGVFVEQITDGSGGSYTTTTPNYYNGMYSCGAYPSGYAYSYSNSDYTFGYFAPADGQENDGVTGTNETLVYASDFSATYSDGSYSGTYSVGPSFSYMYIGGEEFYQWSNGMGRIYSLRFDGTSGYYETNDGG